MNREQLYLSNNYGYYNIMWEMILRWARCLLDLSRFGTNKRLNEEAQTRREFNKVRSTQGSTNCIKGAMTCHQVWCG